MSHVTKPTYLGRLAQKIMADNLGPFVKDEKTSHSLGDGAIYKRVVTTDLQREAEGRKKMNVPSRD